MQLIPVGPNQNEVTFETPTGKLRVFFSYKTPVAAQCQNDQFYRTAKKWSHTTTRHINKWLPTLADVKPQEFFDNLVA